MIFDFAVDAVNRKYLVYDTEILRSIFWFRKNRLIGFDLPSNKQDQRSSYAVKVFSVHPIYDV